MLCLTENHCNKGERIGKDMNEKYQPFWLACSVYRLRRRFVYIYGSQCTINLAWTAAGVVTTSAAQTASAILAGVSISS